MPPAAPPRNPGPQAYSCEISLLPTRNCLVNLPSALVTALVDNNKVAQNVIVELTFLQPQQAQSPSGSSSQSSTKQRSVYAGWTGLQSKRKLAPLVGRDTLAQRTGSAGPREKEIPLVEIDSTFAKLVGLVDGQKVGVFLHTEPPQAHTVNIEPLTATDWEIIELHANFLEINLLSQIRALPNPAFKSTVSSASHPLTLHLSPTSSANIVVTSLSPAPPSSSAFAKIAPDAEVIVAPKSRAKSSAAGKSAESKSVQSDGRSTASPVRPKSKRQDIPNRPPIFLRGVDRSLSEEYFDAHEEIDRNSGFKIWVDWSVLTSKELKRAAWATVSIVRPLGLQRSLDPQQAAQPDQSIKPATRIVAQVCPWEDNPDPRLVALSSQLCTTLETPLMTGETIRIEVAPPQSSSQSIRTLKILPFATATAKEGLQFGGKSKADRQEAARRILSMYGKESTTGKILEGPITDGMILPCPTQLESDDNWKGGLIKFEPSQDVTDESKSPRPWLLGAEKRIEVKKLSESDSSSSSRLTIEVSSESTNFPNSASKWSVGDPLPEKAPLLAGIDTLVSQLTTNIEHHASILLTGGRGSGKTSICQYLAHHFRRSDYFHTIYFPCTKFSSDETRLSTIKDELNRIFGLAAWGARFGGQSLVILDDIDAVCAVETELQGNDNERSKHVSEIVTSLSKQYCSVNSRIVLLATAKSKEDTNNVLIAGHVVREIINIPAPDKDTRRIMLEALSRSSSQEAEPTSMGRSKLDGDAWLDGPISETSSMTGSSKETGLEEDSKETGFVVDPSVDLLDIAGRTDGFMPGDLLLLVARARSEALIRTVSDSSDTSDLIEVYSSDFDAALKGFTPASLRNVTLQHSSTTFASIGGLISTRKTLLETLQYPTLYAPIFARSPLRLRSGLLLYGYPGCGKTLLASAVAGECGLNFISVKGPEILNKYIGASEKSVRDLFERAQAARPCVLFFDEFDSIAPKRGHDSTGVTDRVVNQMLTQMDGAEGLTGVYVLAATSRPDLIDPALLRPGRLDKSLLCDMPTHEDRLDILKALSKKLKIRPSILNDTADNKPQTLAELANRTEGYSGADLQAVIYNAHLEAIHDALKDINRPTSKAGRPGSSHENAHSGYSGGARPIPDFTYFRFGENGVGENGSVATSAAAQAAERSHIYSQLASHRAAQQRAKSARYAMASSAASFSADAKSQAGNNKRQDQEPVIQWEHIEKSLAQTRPSISPEERRRLAGIYREFVVGRNGEMPSGQGGNEIGGRSSLM